MRPYPPPWNLPEVTDEQVKEAMVDVRSIRGAASSSSSTTRKASKGSRSRSPNRVRRHSSDVSMSGALQ